MSSGTALPVVTKVSWQNLLGSRMMSTRLVSLMQPHKRVILQSAAGEELSPLFHFGDCYFAAYAIRALFNPDLALERGQRAELEGLTASIFFFK